jgi:hypothetical protein
LAISNGGFAKLSKAPFGAGFGVGVGEKSAPDCRQAAAAFARANGVFVKPYSAPFGAGFGAGVGEMSASDCRQAVTSTAIFFISRPE